MKYEMEREEGKHSPIEEPGDDLKAPYNRQHCMATAVERMLCGYLGIAWADYDKIVQSLDYHSIEEKLKGKLPAVD